MMSTINEGFWKKYVMIYKIDEGILKIDDNLLVMDDIFIKIDSQCDEINA